MRGAAVGGKYGGCWFGLEWDLAGGFLGWDLEEVRLSYKILNRSQSLKLAS